SKSDGAEHRRKKSARDVSVSRALEGDSCDVGDDDSRGMAGEALQIAGVGRCDDSTSGEICRGDTKRVDCHLRAGARRTEQLSRANGDTRVDRVDLNALAAKPGKDTRVGGTATYDLAQHRGDCRNRQLACAHLRDE